MIPLRTLFHLLAEFIIILHSTKSQKWKEMDIAQQQLSQYPNSTTFQLNELASELKPNQPLSLECLVFGHKGCQLICNLKCLMYGCTCAGICTNANQDVCDCRESYGFGNQYVDSKFFRFLPLSDLWEYRFVRNHASMTVSHFIRQDLKLTQAIGYLLQDAHVTGTQIKYKLMQMFPAAESLLSNLRPIIRGKIDAFLSSRRHFDYPTFTYYLNEYIKAKYEDIERMHIRDDIALDEYFKDHENIKYMVRQLLLFPSKYMQKVMETFCTVTGVSYENITKIAHVDMYTSQNPNHQLTSHQIDEIIEAGVFSQLIEFQNISIDERDDDRKNINN